MTDPLALAAPPSFRGRLERQLRGIALLAIACCWVWLGTTATQSFRHNYEFERRRIQEANMVIFRVCSDAEGLGLARAFVNCEEATIASLSTALWLPALQTTAADVFQSVIVMANRELVRSIQTMGVLGAFFCAAAVMLYVLLSSLFSARAGSAADFEQAMVRMAKLIKSDDGTAAPPGKIKQY